jgi:ribosomal protein L19
MKKVNYGLIRDLESEQLKADRPKFRTGDSLRVHQKVKEGK